MARHLGKPEALAAEVFRPKPVQPPRLNVPDNPQQTTPAPALSPEMEKALVGMASDLQSLRSTVELMAEQMSKLVALGGQQIESIAQFAPLLAQSADGIFGNLRDVVSAIQSIPSASPPEQDPLKAEVPPTRETEFIEQQDDKISSNPKSLEPSRAKERLRVGPRPGTIKSKPRQVDFAPVVVKSIPDAKRSDRFYTSIRLPRNLWEQAGFGPDDRLLLDRNGETLTIDRVAEGGVKPKAVGSASVVLQSWKLGNLNLYQPKVTSTDGSLRLMGGRRQARV